MRPKPSRLTFEEAQQLIALGESEKQGFKLGAEPFGQHQRSRADGCCAALLGQPASGRLLAR
jgi:hypothetical protein